MLVLTRKSLDSVLIGSGVRVTILKVERNQVRIGIEAPAEVSILRAELLTDGRTDGPRATAGRPSPAVVAAGR